jgi:protein TonB
MPHITAATLVTELPRPQPPAARVERPPAEPLRSLRPPARLGADEVAAAPLEPPSSIESETGSEGLEPGRIDGIPDGVVDGVPAADAAPAPEAAGPYRVGTAIKPPRKLRDVRPAYPLDALASQTHGNVVIEATIGVDGKVERATVVRSIATLDQAALDAVRQWEYAPSMLNGVAVAVVMMIVVNFTIQ